MKKTTLYLSFLILIFLAANGCSTKKNTWLSRNYHSMTTKFNIGFNGSQSYKEGLENIEKANIDDYSQILPMYPISNKANQTVATSGMDRTIEKSRKAIKLHSIKKKPVRNYRKSNDPKYKAFYEQNEFNPALKLAWMQLGQAEFHKGDFLGSVGTFSYITKHYASDPNMVAASQIWSARAYSEMDWLYEAEDMLGKVNQDVLNKENTGLFAAVSANLMLKKKQYNDAIPYLKLAIEHEKNKKMLTRFNFIMAQLQEQIGEKEIASEYYTKVIKSIPSYIMEFNARIKRAQLVSSNPQSVEREMKSMARNRNNKDYLDQIYSALGTVFLNQKDTVKAIENYTKGIEKSTRNGIDKGVTLITLGDLYYNRKDYIKAQPCYDEAAKIFTNDYADYQRISKRAEILSELVHENDIVVLQDSLQHLALLPESERLEAINRAIEKIKKDEKVEEERKNNPMASNDDEFTMVPIGSGGGDWYFYNSMSVNSGKSDFRKRWGNRKLEDNWRRTNKSSALFAENTTPGSAAATTTPTTPTTPATSNQENTDENVPVINATTDKTSVDFYLSQIPFTSAQRTKSNEEVATAMYNMGVIYKDKLEDFPMAYNTFDKFKTRFGSDERVLEALYQCFLMASKENEQNVAAQYRNEIISRFPASKYAELLRNPAYIYQLEKMYAEQDSIYNVTYTAYTRSDFQSVFRNVEYLKNKYPLSALMPKFEFLNALSIGKTERTDKFEKSLTGIVEQYPQSDVSAMSKDILALMKQGNVAQLGKTHGSLLDRRSEAETPEELTAVRFSDSKEGKHRLMLITDATGDAMNKLLYNMAIFNFSRFMIKDFDFVVGPVDAQNQALSVTNLESYDEVLWYQKTISTDSHLSQLLDSLHVKEVPISEDNFGKLKTLFTLNDYLAFNEENLVKEKPKPVAVAAVTPVKTDVKTDRKEVTKTTAKETDIEVAEKQPETVQKVVDTETSSKDIVKEPVQTDAKQVQSTTKEPQTLPEQPVVAEEPVIWFKQLFDYRPNTPHYVALYIPTGKLDFPKIQTAFDNYNALNYGMLNLKTSLENAGKIQVIIISTFTNAELAKSYLLRMVKEPALVQALQGVNRRNLIGTQENLNRMIQNNALNTYFEFMNEYYLK